MKYFLLYSENCTPTIKYFNTKKKALEFANKFLKTKCKDTNDNWIDFLVKGSIDSIFSGFEGYKEN